MAMVGWDVANYTRSKPYTQGKSMLMLGNQFWSSDVPPHAEIYGTTEYTTLDLDNGDIQRDLDTDLSDLSESYDVVNNIGTLEHVWNVHQAFGNAAMMVKTGGYYLGTHPTVNFPGHGIHITDRRAIRKFFEHNGFEIKDDWMQDRGAGDWVYWIIAHKLEHRTVFACPKQIWLNDLDAGIS